MRAIGLNGIRRRLRGFTLLEALLAVGVLTVVGVAIATIFGSIGDTIDRGKRISELNQFAARIEGVMRRDFEEMTREGFLVIRHEYANAGFPVPMYEGEPPEDQRARRVDQLMFFAKGDFASARSDIYPGLVPQSTEARVYYGHGQRRVEDFTQSGSLSSAYLDPNLADDGVTQLGLPSAVSEDLLNRAARLGADPISVGLVGSGIVPPNRFASDWTLLRHMTLLAPPLPRFAQPLPDFSEGGLFGLPVDRSGILAPDDNEPEMLEGRRRIIDNPYQLNLQPAIGSIFWNAQEFEFGTPEPINPGVIEPIDNVVFRAYEEPGFGEQIRRARFSSGLIDVASTSLAEIRALVTRGMAKPNDITGSDDFFENRTEMWGLLNQARDVEIRGTTVAGSYIRSFPKSVTSPVQQRAWMINALPVHPAEPSNGDHVFSDPERSDIDRARATSPRMRYEPTPPDISAALSEGTEGETNALERLRLAFGAADQEMLSRSIFVPRCTEFIVEWSFGEVWDNYSGIENVTDPTDLDLRRVEASYRANLRNNAADDPRWKQLVWYGRDRWALDDNGEQIDLDGDGERNYDLGDRVAQFYNETENDLADVPQVLVNLAEDANREYARINPNNPFLYSQQDINEFVAAARAKDSRWIVGRDGRTDEPDDRDPFGEGSQGRGQIETATFGYYYYDGGGVYFRNQLPGDTRDDVVADWPWPRFLRITFGLADPNDPSIESRYQVVFELPEAAE